MSERERVKIVEPGFATKAIVTAVVLVLVLVGASRAGSLIFGPDGGEGLKFRDQLIARGIQVVKDDLTGVKVRLSAIGQGLYRSAVRAQSIPVAQAAGSENFRGQLAAANPMAAKALPPEAGAAAQFLIQQAADLSRDASADNGIVATTDRSTYQVDAETAAQLGSLGTATHSFWRTAWQKSWPFIKHAAGWCWTKLKQTANYVAGAFKSGPAPAEDGREASLDLPNAADATVPAS